MWRNTAPYDGRFASYLSAYQDIFRSETKYFFDKAQTYCQGIFMSEISNIERVSEEMFANYHQMQHFITESPWDYRELIDKVALDVGKSLPRRKLTGLIIDESGWEKKGKKSVGVAPQYCGNVGEIANSQVAVFGALSNGDFASMVDARLYLPKSWCSDPVRCDEAGIPDEQRVFKKKWEIAVDMVKHQKLLGVDFNYVGGDGYYGNSTELAEAIGEMGYVYMLDIHSNQTLYFEECAVEIRERKSKKGKAPTKPQPSSKGTRADRYMSGLEEKDWQSIEVRNTSKGVLKGGYHFRKVYIFDQDNCRMLRRLLMIRRTKNSKGDWEYKYSFTNANLEQYTEKGIAYMQAQRFFVEHCIKENKQILGMGKYQTHKWLAWQHQIALNFLLSTFVLKEKLLCFDNVPLLSARDIKRWIIFKLYRQMSEDDIIDQMFERHCRRQTNINNAFERQENEMC
ncbi:MAG: IS701 family transposase [Mangrovibacterium sp.]